jgi:hypothetical protein
MAVDPVIYFRDSQMDEGRMHKLESLDVWSPAALYRGITHSPP